MAAWLDALAAGGFLGKSFVWDADGNCRFADTVSAEDREAIAAIFAAPPGRTPLRRRAGHSPGCVTWGPSTAWLICAPAATSRSKK
jgi:hypothetical protein